jgi:hypothetical protein
MATYTITTLNDPQGVNDTRGKAINASGQVVGQ